MRLVKRVLKILGGLTVLCIVILYWLFASYTTPKSDKEVLELFSEALYKPVLSHEQFKRFSYRKLSIVTDTTLPTLIFVHGTIGSSTDFSAYMKDSLLLAKANMISYDRIGYNYQDPFPVQESIAFESALLEDLTKGINPKKTILVGYSYGGPIALAVQKKYKKILLLAPAVYSKVEPMPWMLNFYKWRLTRWLVPEVWKEASKEKMSHPRDLQKFEDQWKTTPNNVTTVHGDADWIVPYANTTFLAEQFSKEQLELVTLKGVGHDLIWSRFKEIKEQLIKQLD